MEIFDEPVQLTRRDSFESRFVDVPDHIEQLLYAGAFEGRHEDHWRVFEKFQAVADILLEFTALLGGSKIPFVDAEDHGTSAFVGVSGDGGVEGHEALARIH